MFALPDSLVASAIVTFVSPSDAALVMHAINGKYIGGNKIEVTHTTNSPNKLQDVGWGATALQAHDSNTKQRRFFSEQQPLKIPAVGESPRYFSAPHDRFTFQPVPQPKPPTAAIGEERNSSNSSLESLLERVNLDDSKRRHPHSPETGGSSFNDNSVSTNEVATPNSASRQFTIQSSPLSEVSMFKNGADKENSPFINRQNQRFTID